MTGETQQFGSGTVQEPPELWFHYLKWIAYVTKACQLQLNRLMLSWLLINSLILNPNLFHPFPNLEHAQRRGECYNQSNLGKCDTLSRDLMCDMSQRDQKRRMMPRGHPGTTQGLRDWSPWTQQLSDCSGCACNGYLVGSK
jgi:hypothetical protein